MPRKFTLQQAEALLPELEKTVRRALAIKAEYTEVESKLASESRRRSSATSSSIAGPT